METKAKRLYNQVSRELLNKGEDEELRGKLEIMRLFLETVDFNKLRSESEKNLVEDKNVKFLLHLENGELNYEMKLTE